jgi:DNA/RNA endonuclease YhcR with UshA esterase domain
MICRKCKWKMVAVSVVAALSATLGHAQSSISATEARNHVGEKATVCGEVASAKYAARSRGNPTFLNLDKPYPNQIFTVLIWGSDRAKFGDPEQTYRDKHICVTGKISDYKGTPEMIASDPAQIKTR